MLQKSRNPLLVTAHCSSNRDLHATALPTTKKWNVMSQHLIQSIGKFLFVACRAFENKYRHKESCSMAYRASIAKAAWYAYTIRRACCIDTMCRNNDNGLNPQLKLRETPLHFTVDDLQKTQETCRQIFFCIFLLILSLTLYLSNENTCITHYWSSSERILGSIWNTWTNVSKTIMQTHGKFHASASQAELYRGQTISQALDSNSSTLVVLFAAKSRLAQEFTGLVPQTQCNNRSKPNKLFGKNKY